MSTKQTVIFTFMIVFMGVMFFCLGSWFYYATKLDIKKKQISVLEQHKRELQIQIGEVPMPGIVSLKQAINDPQAGLVRQRELKISIAQSMKGNEQSGTEQRRKLYDDMLPEMEKKWDAAAGRWAELYKDWDNLNKDLATAKQKLDDMYKESEQKVSGAQTELESALNEENIKRREIVNERKKNDDTIARIKYEREDVMDKVGGVTREIRKDTKITPQAHIIYAAEDLKSVTIDQGSRAGIRKDMKFVIYSGAHAGLLKKGVMRIVNVRASSADGLLLAEQVNPKIDLQTGWVPPDAGMRYSPFSTEGETNAEELKTPPSRAERLEALRKEKGRELEGLGSGGAEATTRDENPQSAPPVARGTGFVPIMAGDWVFNADFVPILPDDVYQKKTVEELLATRDVNIGSLTFYFSDSVSRTYRREVLKRLCERNSCKTVDAVTPDVAYIVTASGMSNIEALHKMLGDKERENENVETKALRATMTALQEGAKYGACGMGEDQLEDFFKLRARKIELLRGKAVQPGQHVFYVAGQTRDRSVGQVQAFIRDHGGVVAIQLPAFAQDIVEDSIRQIEDGASESAMLEWALGQNRATFSEDMINKMRDGKVPQKVIGILQNNRNAAAVDVDYVVVGDGLDDAFFEKIKSLGLKIIREDELPRFFGAE